MAKPIVAATEGDDARERPVRTMIALVVAFLALVAIATWTVLVPELSDDAGEEDGGSRPADPSDAPPAT